MSMKYTKEHEWVRLDGDVAVCGITAYAVEQLGDVVYVELPALGHVVKKDGEMAVVESAKAASDVYAPLSGAVVEINDKLGDSPETVNVSPEGDGWFVKIAVADRAELDALLDADQYAEYIGSL